MIGIFPDDASLIRIATSLVIEQSVEWLVGRRYLSLDSLAPLLEERGDQQDQEVLELTAKPRNKPRTRRLRGTSG